MHAWLSHLLVGSLGLIAVFLVALLLRLAARRDPILCHHGLRIAVLCALASPWVQLALGGRAQDLPLGLHAAAAWLYLEPPQPRSEAAAAAPARPASEAPAAPRAYPAPVHALPVSTDTVPVMAGATPRHSPLAGEVEPSDPALAAPSPDPAHWSWILLAVYLAGAVFAGVRHLRRIAGTRRFLRGTAPVRHPAVCAAWQRLAGSSRVGRRARLHHSAHLRVPACWGLLRPIVVIPSRDAGSAPTPALEWAMLHELVHLERRDPWMTLVQGVLQVLYWFHPAAHGLTRALDRVRELACDLEVVRRAGRRKSYALALLEYAQPAVLPVPSAAIAAPCTFDLLHWSESAAHLRRRIEMLFQSRTPLPRNRRALYAGLAGAALAAAFAGQIALASAFPAEDEVLMACDPKKKKPRPAAPSCRPSLDQPRPATPRTTPPLDVTGGNGAVRPADVLTRLRQERGATGLVTVAAASMAAPARLDPEVQAALVHTLRNDDYEAVRMAAAQALAPYAGEADVRQALLAALRNQSDAVVRAAILDALLKREAISPELKELLAELCALPGDEVLQIAVTEGLRSFGDDPEARDVLLRSLQSDGNAMVQMNAVKGLAPYVADSRVREALVAALRRSSNEVARMVMLDALAPLLPDHADVRELFALIMERDDNPVARATACDALTLRADDADVRLVLVRMLQRDVGAAVQMRLAEALAPYAGAADVKQAFVQSLRRIDNEVVRMTMVQALAADPGAPSDWHRARPDYPGPLPYGSQGDLLPAVSSRF